VKVKVFKNGELNYENRLYQKVNEKVIPVITPEAVEAVKPTLPQLAQEEGEEVVLPPEEAVRAVAPAQAPAESKLFLIFGLVGFAFGFIALMAVIVVLIMLLKRERQVTIQGYMNQRPTERPNDKGLNEQR